MLIKINKGLFYFDWHFDFFFHSREVWNWERIKFIDSLQNYLLIEKRMMESVDGFVLLHVYMRSLLHAHNHPFLYYR